jgi:hypothetical protein
MASVRVPAPAPNPNPRPTLPLPPPPPRTAAEVLCALWINRVAYEVAMLTPGAGVRKAYRLHNAVNGKVYDVSLDCHGVACECGDWLYRRDGKDPQGCKHIQALRQLGMMPGPEPAQPTGAELAEVLAGAPAAEPMTPEDVAEMADWFLADEAQRSARCPVCNGRKEDDMGGWCLGCGGIGVVPQ